MIGSVSKHRSWTAAAPLALALGACAPFGPHYRAPETAGFETPAFINQDAYEATEPSSAWWTAFGDQTLNDLVLMGLAENKTLRAAVENVNASRAAVGLARLDRAPFDQLSSSYLRSRSGSAVFAASTGLGSGGGTFPTNDISTVSVNSTWEVDLFGRVTREINLAKADLGRSQADLADLQVTVISDIADAYVRLRGLQRRLKVASENAENQTSTLKLTEATRDAGRGTDFDVERAKAQLSGTRATIPPLEAEIAATTYALGVLIGKTPAEITALLNASADLPAITSSIAIGDPAALLRRRPDIRVQERALASATERIGLNIADAFPRVELIGNGGFQAIDFENQFGPKALNFSFGPSISWSLTNIIRARSRVNAASASARAAFAGYEQTVLAALAETESALKRQGSLQKQLADLREAKRASGEAARLAEFRYQNGATDFLSVLDAQRRELEAAESLAAAETAAAQSQVAVFRALRAGPTTP